MDSISNVNSILVFAHEISDLNMLLAKLINAKLPVQVEWDISAQQLDISASMLHRLLGLKKDYFPNVKVNINVRPPLYLNRDIEYHMHLIKD